MTQFEKALPAIECGYSEAANYEELLRDFMESLS